MCIVRGREIKLRVTILIILKYIYNRKLHWYLSNTSICTIEAYGWNICIYRRSMIQSYRQPSWFHSMNEGGKVIFYEEKDIQILIEYQFQFVWYSPSVHFFSCALKYVHRLRERTIHIDRYQYMTRWYGMVCAKSLFPSEKCVFLPVQNVIICETYLYYHHYVVKISFVCYMIQNQVFVVTSLSISIALLFAIESKESHIFLFGVTYVCCKKKTSVNSQTFSI